MKQWFVSWPLMERGSTNLEEGIGEKGGDRGGREKKQEGGETDRPCQKAPMLSSTTSLNLSSGVTGRCSAFSMIMAELLSS